MPYADPERKRENNSARAANRDKIRERRSARREPINTRRRASYARRRDELREARKRDPSAQDDRWVSTLWQKHGMRPHEWSSMWAAQAGRCYLCDQALGEPGHGVHVDHDHSCCPQARSCRFCRRGLACGKCNVAIAMAGDDPARLRLQADRLEAAKCVATERMAARPTALLLWADNR